MVPFACTPRSTRLARAEKLFLERIHVVNDIFHGVMIESANVQW